MMLIALKFARNLVLLTSFVNSFCSCGRHMLTKCAVLCQCCATVGLPVNLLYHLSYVQPSVAEPLWLPLL